MKLSFIEFNKILTEGGALVSLEGNKNIPFNIKRIYYIFGNDKNVRRGFHAHLHLKQVVIAMNGSCTFLLDDGKTKLEVELNDRSKGLLVEGLIWREMFNFSHDCVLVVLASEFYDEKDYIRDYNEFLNKVNSLPVS